MLNELTCVLHVEESVQEKKPTGPTFAINSQKINKEESKHRSPPRQSESVNSFPSVSKSSSSVEIEVNDRKYFAEELVLFKHFKLTLEVFF